MDAGNGNVVGEKRRFPSWMLGKSDDIKAEDFSFTLKSCVTTRKRKTGQKRVDEHHHNSKSEDIVPEIESGPQKRQRRKSSRVQASLELEIDDDDCDDGVELNVDDLISIANEYVRADTNAKQQLSDQTCEREPKTVSNETVYARQAVSTDSSINEGVFDSTCRTGDPAQDMLNLFLGPLLNKPPREEKKQEMVTVTDHVKFVQEYRRNAPVVDEFVTKKKSSLKDMVAMFLD